MDDGLNIQLKFSRMRLGHGKSFKFGEFYIHQLTLNEIDEMEEDKYNAMLSLLLYEDEYEETDTFVKLMDDCIGDVAMEKFICEALSVFVKEPVTFVPIIETESMTDSFFYVGDTSEFIGSIGNEENLSKMDGMRTINKYNYIYIKEILMVFNCIDKKPKLGENEKQKQIMKDQAERVRLAKEKINKQLNKTAQDDETIELIDLISVVACNSNSYNLFNIWDLTVYQFQNQFKVMKFVENFDLSFQQLLAGADSKSINLEYYVKRIK